MTWIITHEGLIESGRLRLLTVPSCLVLLYHWSSSGVPQLCVLILVGLQGCDTGPIPSRGWKLRRVQHLQVLRLNGFTTHSAACSQYSESQVLLAVNIRSSPGCDAATCQVRPGTRIVQEIVSVPFELWCFLSFLVFSYNCQVGHVQGKLVPAQRWGHGIFWYYLTLSCLTSDF